jgi:hypothetical protein
MHDRISVTCTADVVDTLSNIGPRAVMVVVEVLPCSMFGVLLKFIDFHVKQMDNNSVLLFYLVFCRISRIVPDIDSGEDSDKWTPN